MSHPSLQNLDKSTWERLPFGEIAKSIGERVDPTTTDLATYVGLEHIDPESIHIKRFGKREDVIGTKLRCYPGDVIFGRRRAYQRKSAICEFEGFCSAHSLVLRAITEVIDPKIFPFFLHSDQFMHRAVDISVGGLSPTINWTKLKTQEFLIPPKDQQGKLAELLLRSDEAIKKGIETTEKTGDVLSAEIESEIQGVSLDGRTINAVLAEISGGTDLISLKDCGEIYKGKGIPKSAVVDQGVPCIRYGELYTRHHRIIRHYNSFIEEATIPSALKLEINDVLFAGSGETITEIGKSAAFVSTDDAYAGSDILVFRPHSMDGRFLGYLMNSEIVRQQLNKYGTGATVMHIYKSDLEQIRIPKISLNTQIKIGRKLENYAQILSQTEARVEHSKTLLKSLINQIF